MATYTELYGVASSRQLLERVTIAVAIAANAIRNEDNTVTDLEGRRRWAFRALTNPEGEAQKMVWALLAGNASATLTQINNVTDAAIQTAVNDLVALFAKVV